MNSPAAFRATVHSLRQVPSRKICQLVLELPIEETASVAAIAEHGTWVGIARLQNPEGAALATPGQEREASPSGTTPPAPLQSSDKPDKRRWGDLSLSQQSAIRCREPVFRKFLEDWCGGRQFNDEITAADFVRNHCGVLSRTEIHPRTPAADSWCRIENSYQAWLIANKMGAL